MKRLIVLTLVFGLILSACTPAHSIINSTPTSPQNATSTAVQSPDNTPYPANTVLEYTRSGGLQGKTEVWLIDADGHVTGPAGQTGQIDQADLSRLVADIEGVDPASIQPDNGTQAPACNDCYTYQVVVRSQGVEKSFTAFDAQPNVPQTFWSALNQLQRAITPN